MTTNPMTTNPTTTGPTTADVVTERLPTGARHAHRRPATDRPDGRAVVRSMLLDVGLPVGAYYAARLAGCDSYTALLAGTLTSGTRVAWVAVAQRRLDAFGGMLLLLFGAGLGLSLLTGDARFVLAKDSATSGLAGLAFLASVALHRPLTRTAAQRMVGPAARERIEAGWADGSRRHPWYVSSTVWGVGLLAESLARVAVIYLFTPDTAVAASTVLQITAFGLLTAWNVRYGKRTAAGS